MIETLVTVAIFGGVFFAIVKAVRPDLIQRVAAPAPAPAPADDTAQVHRFVEATARLERRVDTIERIIAADSPGWRG